MKTLLELIVLGAYILPALGCGTEVGNGFDPNPKSKEESPEDSQKQSAAPHESLQPEAAEDLENLENDITDYIQLDWQAAEDFNTKNEAAIQKIEANSKDMWVIHTLAPCNPILRKHPASIWNSDNKVSQKLRVSTSFLVDETNLLMSKVLDTEEDLPFCESKQLTTEERQYIDFNETQIDSVTVITVLDLSYIYLLATKPDDGTYMHIYTSDFKLQHSYKKKASN